MGQSQHSSWSLKTGWFSSSHSTSAFYAQSSWYSAPRQSSSSLLTHQSASSSLRWRTTSSTMGSSERKMVEESTNRSLKCIHGTPARLHSYSEFRDIQITMFIRIDHTKFWGRLTKHHSSHLTTSTLCFWPAGLQAGSTWWIQNCTAIRPNKDRVATQKHLWIEIPKDKSTLISSHSTSASLWSSILTFDI